MDEKSPLNAKTCRLCPSDDFLTDLYHPTNLEVRKVINLFVNIEEENSAENLPKFICEICEHILRSIIEFRDKCVERDNELRGNVQKDSKNLIKVEELKQNPIEEEALPIEVLLIKEEEVSDEFLVEYLENETIEEEDKPIAKKRNRSKRDHPCLLCKQVYSTWSKLMEHKKADHLQCPVCLKTFRSYGLMAHHKVNVHAGDTHCHLCGKHILNRVRLLKHIRSVHNMERDHKCETCGVGFFYKSKLVIHMSTHNDPNSEICDFENCGKMFKNIVNLKKHKQSHFPVSSVERDVDKTEDKTSVKEKPKTNSIKRLKPSKTIVCQYCGKILKTSTGYDIHIRVHRNEKPFDCPDCDRKFRDKRSLTIHGFSHKNIRAYQCDLCPKSFYTNSNLKKHKISLHETEMKHECIICGKRTKLKSNLTLHMKTHGVGINKNDLNKIDLG